MAQSLFWALALMGWGVLCGWRIGHARGRRLTESDTARLLASLRRPARPKH